MFEGLVFGGLGVRGLGFGLNCRADWSMRASNKFVHTLSGSGFRVASLVFLVSVARFLFSVVTFLVSVFSFLVSLSGAGLRCSSGR